MLTVDSPLAQFFDITGIPLQGGLIYVGTANQNPETTPQSVYWDSALTQPAAQPVQTLNGYPVRNGMPAQLYVAANYSMTVRNSAGAMVLFAPDATKFSLAAQINQSTGATQVGYLLPTSGATPRTVAAKLNEWTSVLDFPGVDPTGATDSTSAIQAAANQCGSGTLFFPNGRYKLTGTVNLPRYCSVEGESTFGVVIDITGVASGSAGFYFYGNQFEIRKLTITAGSTQWGIYSKNAYIAIYDSLYFINCAQGINLDEAGSSRVTHSNFQNCGIGVLAQGGSGYVVDDCDFNTAETIGVQTGVSPTSGNPTSISVVHSRFSCGTGINAPANGTQTLYCDDLYFEGTNTTTCSPYQIGTSGTGTIQRVVIKNSIVANSYNSGSSIANATYVELAGNIWGQVINIQNTVSYFCQSGPDWYYSSSGYYTNNATNKIEQQGGVFKPSVIKSKWLDETTVSTAARMWDGTHGVENLSDRFRPIVDNYTSLGDNTHNWINIYSEAAVTVVSDERKKTSVEGIPPAWLAAWSDVQWVRYKKLDEPKNSPHSGKWHLGLIAQRVRDSFLAHGVDPVEIGILVHDEWEDGGVKFDRYGVRYEEALSLECALIRSRLDALHP